MASELRLTTLANNAGTESVNTTYVINGSAKAWIDILTGSSIGDSLNITSFTDNGVGDYTQNFTSAFNNSNYSTSVSGGSGRSSSATLYWGGYKSSAPTTTTARTALVHSSGSAGDPADGCSSIHGDLA